MIAPLSVRYVPLNQLTGYARNPRKNQHVIPRMVSSIKEFGFAIPVLVKPDYEIIDGHLRALAARELQMAEVPVIVADGWSEAQVKAFRLLANRSANWAEWDDDLLRLELEELKGLDFDLSLTGFDPPELADLIDPFSDSDETTLDEEGEELIDRAEQLQEKWRVETGDLWQCGRHRLICGDSTEPSVLDRLCGSDAVRVVLTDPPYGLADTVSPKNDYDRYVDSRENLIQLIARFMPLALKRFDLIVLTPGNGNVFRYPEPTWTMAWFTPAGVGRGPWGFCCWQPILCYGKDPKLAAGQGCHPDALVLTESSEKLGHPCSKPIGFWSWLMERISETEQVIVDPFAGSGTTLVAAERLGRTAFCVELSPAYCAIVLERSVGLDLKPHKIG